jgi:hypothetical protein
MAYVAGAIIVGGVLAGMVAQHVETEREKEHLVWLAKRALRRGRYTEARVSMELDSGGSSCRTAAVEDSEICLFFYCVFAEDFRRAKEPF